MKKSKQSRIVANAIVLSRLFEKALLYAARIHAKQVRKRTNRPYIGHLLSVASIVIEFDGDEDMAIAALLHDAVEDQGGLSRLKDIRRRFGKRVAHIVDGCTDSHTAPKLPWIDRKRAYLERIPKEVADVRLVSAADKLSNARETLQDVRAHGVEVFESFAGKKDGTLWYYQALVEKFREVESSALVEELAQVVARLKRLSTTRSLERNRNQKEKRRRAE
ncbi:MAG TPA: HD domain-containing protein [Candidatus Acidoferrum sp.]